MIQPIDKVKVSPTAPGSGYDGASMACGTTVLESILLVLALFEVSAN